MVSNVPPQLSRPRADAAGSRGGGGSHNDFPVDPGTCHRIGKANPAAFENEQRLVAGGRALFQGEGLVELSLSGGQQVQPDDRHPAFGQTGRCGGEAVPPQDAGPATDREPAHDHRVQETVLPQDRRGNENDCELWRRSWLRQVKYLNNAVGQDCWRIKRMTGPGLGFCEFWTARRTLAGFEAMAMIRKGQSQNVSGNDIRVQGVFVAGVYQIAAL